MKSRKEHWEGIYQTKKSDEMSWSQLTPSTSLDFLHGFNLEKNAPIIDVGGGDSRLVDHLLDEGFSDITVLDISAVALQRARERLGDKATRVQWIESDIIEFVPSRQYHVWHDRATFHFQTEEDQIKKYISIASKGLDHDGYLTIGTFSSTGPSKCSGLIIRQYSDAALSAALKSEFNKLRCITEDHQTPFHTIQNFLFCSFIKAA
ncbi:MAG: class I SAM-dependent methyltransferase [Bacteroidetes bacterium]|nr:class I SAM-dependent methyltransferase [Bacteroidota bacterium]